MKITKSSKNIQDTQNQQRQRNLNSSLCYISSKIARQLESDFVLDL